MKVTYISIMTLICCALITLCVWHPEYLTENNFLNNFINHEIINILAVMVTITTAASAQLHLELNRIEQQKGEEVFFSTRKEIKDNVVGIVLIFLIGILILIFKSWIDNTHGKALMISLMLIFLVTSTVLMYDIVACIFQIPAFLGKPDIAPASTTKQNGHLATQVEKQAEPQH